jgi:hypothetical protein
MLYLIRDEYYASRGSQLYSDKGELWKYGIKVGALQLVLKPFQSYSYFLGIKDGMYFSAPTPNGDLKLRYFNGNGVTDIDQSTVADVSRDKLAGGSEFQTPGAIETRNDRYQ